MSIPLTGQRTLLLSHNLSTKIQKLKEKITGSKTLCTLTILLLGLIWGPVGSRPPAILTPRVAITALPALLITSLLLLLATVASVTYQKKGGIF